VNDAYRILVVWKNKFNINGSEFMEADDGMAFTNICKER